jgi:hypothetical protein
MIRTLTLVSVLALIAGVAMGFFIASAAERTTAGSSTAGASSANSAVEAKVRDYINEFGLTSADGDEVRATYVEYDRRIADVFSRLRQQHRDEFTALADRANARIRAVLARYPNHGKK